MLFLPPRSTLPIASNPFGASIPFYISFAMKKFEWVMSPHQRKSFQSTFATLTQQSGQNAVTGSCVAILSVISEVFSAVLVD